MGKGVMAFAADYERVRSRMQLVPTARAASVEKRSFFLVIPFFLKKIQKTQENEEYIFS